MLQQLTDLSAQQCRQQASNCRDLAIHIMIERHQIMLKHIADTWERMADDIEAEVLD